MRLSALFVGLCLFCAPLTIHAASSTTPRLQVLKNADKEEARPGDTVAYTITLRNLTDAPIMDIDIEDGCEDGDVTVIDVGDGATVDSDGTIHWHIDELAPREARVLRYRVTIGPNEQQLVIRNSVTVWTGDGGVLSASHVLGLFRELPQTGIAVPPVKIEASPAPVRTPASMPSALLISMIAILVGGAVSGAYVVGRGTR